jgi:hypothetical protein
VSMLVEGKNGAIYLELHFTRIMGSLLSPGSFYGVYGVSLIY